MKHPSLEEREIRRMFINEPLKMDIGLLRLKNLTAYEMDMQEIDIKLKHKVLDEYQSKLEYLRVNYKHQRICDENEYKSKMLDIHLHYKKITEKEYSAAKIELMQDESLRTIAVLEHLLKFDEITQDEFDKEMSTLKGIPWFKFCAELHDEDGVKMTVQYNELFIKKCKADGHPGETEDEVIDNFIKDFGRKLHADDSDVPESVVLMEDQIRTNPDIV